MITCPSCNYTRTIDSVPRNRCPKCAETYPDDLLKTEGENANTRADPKATNASSNRKPSKTYSYYCQSCSKSFNLPGRRGNGWIELILYFAYFLPGLIYTIWRSSKDGRVCPHCRSKSIISTKAGTHVKCPECSEFVLAEASKCKHCGSKLAPQR